MKSIIKLLFIIPALFIASCFNANRGSNYKIVLDISIGSYINSLTNGEIAISKAFENRLPPAATDKEIVNNLIETYSHLKSGNWVMEVFAKNKMLPRFENITELKSFLYSDYYTRSRRMHEVIRNRISNFTGTPKDKIKIKQTKSRIIIFVQGVENRENIDAAFENRNGINFWEVAQLNEIADLVAKFNDTLTSLIPKKPLRPIDTSKELSLQDAIDRGDMEEKTKDALFKLLIPAIDPSGKPYGAAFWAVASVKDTATINAYLASTVYKAIFPEHIKMLWGDMPGKQESPKTSLALYAIKTGFEGRPLVSGDDIKSAKFDYINGRSEISVEMNARGAANWANATQQCTGKPIAIEMNNIVLSAPNVTEKITGGRSSITGDFSAKEGIDLAMAINSGSFPLAFKLVSIEKYNGTKQD